MPEQASYDVTYYDLHLNVSPGDSSIAGYVLIQANIVQPVEYFVVDLDTLLNISNITELESGQEKGRKYNRDIGRIWIDLEGTRQAGEAIKIKIEYSGQPRIAKRAPWDGGFTWAQTSNGQPWIGTTCQGEGADIWWPVKDHVSDEPDSMGIHIRVPDPLICASNGKLLSVEHHTDQTSTFHWFVSTPINTYDVALNIAPYKLIEQQYTSTCGDQFPVMFWVLPEDYEKGLKILPEFVDHLRFFETNLGPYPFRADKYGIAESPYLGMEHQTIIAYGANFNNAAMTGRDWGFDALHHHELSHEWFGNLVTNADWKDMWLHEGFGTYMQALYMEQLAGIEGYHAYIAAQQHFSNDLAIAPKNSTTANQIYKSPIYSKGATVLHMLRYLIGEDKLRKSLRLMAYPSPDLEHETDGSQTRFASTNDFKKIVKDLSQTKLDWFFEMYVHQPELPELNARLEDTTLTISWDTPGNMPFPMPLDIKIGNKTERFQLSTVEKKIYVPLKAAIVFDPDKWVLYEPKDLQAGIKLINKREYKEATELFMNKLFIEPENKTALNMSAIANYAMRNPEKIDGNFFDPYLVNYITKNKRKYSFSREENNFYMTSSRGKFQIYPISDTTFIFTDFDAKVYFGTDRMYFEMGAISVEATVQNK